MATVQHMVLVKYKPETSDAMIATFSAELFALKESIPGIRYFRGGPYASPEGLNRGLSHGYLVTFESPQARDAYLPHPEHERVKNLVLPHVEDVVVFDFEE